MCAPSRTNDHAVGDADVDAGAVLAWGMPRLRDLPWRRDRDPWAILVAEVMLQQTQAQRVIPKWEAFLAAYPDAGAPAPPRRSATCCGCGTASAIRAGPAICTSPRAAIVDRHDGVVPDRSRRPARAAGDRAVHRPRRARVRVRARRGGRRHEHRPRARPHVRGAADAEARPGGGRRARAARRGLGVEPDPDGPRRHRCAGPTPVCDECPVESTCRWRSTGLAGAGSCRRVGGREHASSRVSRAATARPVAGCSSELVGGARPGGEFRPADPRRPRRRRPRRRRRRHRLPAVTPPVVLPISAASCLGAIPFSNSIVSCPRRSDSGVLPAVDDRANSFGGAAGRERDRAIGEPHDDPSGGDQFAVASTVPLELVAGQPVGRPTVTLEHDRRPDRSRSRPPSPRFACGTRPAGAGSG